MFASGRVCLMCESRSRARNQTRCRECTNAVMALYRFWRYDFGGRPGEKSRRWSRWNQALARV